MSIKVYDIPPDYKIKKWGDIGNLERWYQNQQGAYLDRRILLKYNPKLPPETFLVYYGSAANAFTILERTA